MVRLLRRLFIDSKDQYVTRKEFETHCSRHMEANTQQWEAVHAVVVDTREQMKGMSGLLGNYHETVLHHVECLEQGMQGLRDRISILEEKAAHK